MKRDKRRSAQQRSQVQPLQQPPCSFTGKRGTRTLTDRRKKGEMGGEKSAELAVCGLQQDPGWAWDVVGDSARHQAAPGLQCGISVPQSADRGSLLRWGAGTWGLFWAVGTLGPCQGSAWGLPDSVTAQTPRFRPEIVVVGTRRACLPGARTTGAAWTQHGSRSGALGTWLLSSARIGPSTASLDRSLATTSNNTAQEALSETCLTLVRTEDWLPGCCVCKFQLGTFMNFSRLSQGVFHTQVSSSRQRQRKTTSFPDYECCFVYPCGCLGCTPLSSHSPQYSMLPSSFFLGPVDAAVFQNASVGPRWPRAGAVDAASGPDAIPGACASPGVSWLVRSFAHRTK